MSRDGLSLSAEVLAKCRAYAIADVLAKHHEEFQTEYLRLIKQRIERAETLPFNTPPIMGAEAPT